MRTSCDKCKKVYDLSELNADNFEKLPNNVEWYYMECPNCKERYTSHYVNDEIKEVQLQIMALHDKKHNLGIKERNRLNGLVRRILVMFGQLKDEMEAKMKR